jgi:hypothetical protein
MSNPRSKLKSQLACAIISALYVRRSNGTVTRPAPVTRPSGHRVRREDENTNTKFHTTIWIPILRSYFPEHFNLRTLKSWAVFTVCFGTFRKPPQSFKLAQFGMPMNNFMTEACNTSCYCISCSWNKPDCVKVAILWVLCCGKCLKKIIAQFSISFGLTTPYRKITAC